MPPLQERAEIQNNNEDEKRTGFSSDCAPEVDAVESAPSPLE